MAKIKLYPRKYVSQYYEKANGEHYERKHCIVSLYETECVNIDNVRVSCFIARMSDGVTWWCYKGGRMGILTRHMVRRGTNVENTTDIDVFNVYEPINTLERFKKLIEL